VGIGASSALAALPLTGVLNCGVTSGCPYCLAKENPWPSKGTPLVFLNGMDSGWSGIVVEDPWGTCPSDRFLVKMEYEKRSDWLQTVMPSHQLYIDSRQYAVPDWMPPLSIEDNALLHESLMATLPLLAPGQASDMKHNPLWRIVNICWRRRLPLDRNDIWPMMEAHGVELRHKSRLLDFIEFGILVLTATHGRPAVKRRRMAPMSKGRYLTNAQRELRIQLFGHH
jgi:hypothetical protein